ncbi:MULTISPECIES: DNA adenine methylase [Staphylococcus]|uniref:DNA adenine methylase n=1 Tax=Staphylococcus TaxID=1279 RepID=UPI000852F70F|nr:MULTISPECIES: DNA adenine methylase [Staphylococcus]OEK61764.1 DNA methyltransferase [Staphylococcus equorum]
MNNLFDVKYPKVNYIGNKEKLSEWIVDNIPFDTGTVLDIFAGGNSVSFELKKRGFKVYSNDVLYASFVLSKSLIENSTEILSEDHIDKASYIELSKEEREKFNWLENKLYYSSEVDELAKLVKYSDTLSGYSKYIFQSLIRRAMIRKLPYSRMNVPWNNIVKLRDEDYSYEKYGRKRAYHNQSFSHHMRSNLISYNNAVFNNGHSNKAFQEDALDVLDMIDKVSGILLDPPYPGTMNKYEDFYSDFDVMFETKKQFTNLSDRNNFMANLENIIKKAVTKTEYIILCLNSNSKPGSDDVSRMFEKYGTVTIIEKKHNYQVSGKVNKNTNLEQLIILKVGKDLNEETKEIDKEPKV